VPALLLESMWMTKRAGEFKYPHEVVKQDIVNAVSELYQLHGAGNQMTLDSIRSYMVYKLPKSTLKPLVVACVNEGLIHRFSLHRNSPKARPIYSYKPTKY